MPRLSDGTKLCTNPREFCYAAHSTEDWVGGGGWTRTNDLGIMSPIRPAENKADQQLPSADSGKVLQNPQPRRNKISAVNPFDISRDEEEHS